MLDKLIQFTLGTILSLIILYVGVTVFFLGNNDITILIRNNLERYKYYGKN